MPVRSAITRGLPDLERGPAAAARGHVGRGVAVRGDERDAARGHARAGEHARDGRGQPLAELDVEARELEGVHVRAGAGAARGTPRDTAP